MCVYIIKDYLKILVMGSSIYLVARNAKTGATMISNKGLNNGNSAQPFHFSQLVGSTVLFAHWPSGIPLIAKEHSPIKGQ